MVLNLRDVAQHCTLLNVLQMLSIRLNLSCQNGILLSFCEEKYFLLYLMVNIGKIQRE